MASCQIDYVRFLEPKITLVLFPESIPSPQQVDNKTWEDWLFAIPCCIHWEVRGHSLALLLEASVVDSNTALPFFWHFLHEDYYLQMWLISVQRWQLGMLKSIKTASLNNPDYSLKLSIWKFGLGITPSCVLFILVATLFSACHWDSLLEDSRKILIAHQKLPPFQLSLKSSGQLLNYFMCTGIFYCLLCNRLCPKLCQKA